MRSAARRHYEAHSVGVGQDYRSVVAANPTAGSPTEPNEGRSGRANEDPRLH